MSVICLVESGQPCDLMALAIVIGFVVGVWASDSDSDIESDSASSSQAVQ